jgi:L-aspartate oxidase
MVTDILVIGSGIAGLSYALEMGMQNPNTRIIIISKRSAIESNTRYAQGGIAVVQDFMEDSFEKHIEDTYLAGDKTGNLEVIRKVIEDGPPRLKQLLNWGVEFDTKFDEKNKITFDLAREGGHSAYRVVHKKDHSGYEIQLALLKKIAAFPNITLLENHTLVDIITDHHLPEPALGACYGAYVISINELKVIKINAQLTILSTGGAGQIYKFSTNPSGATGDGIAAAYRAKVKIEGLHLVQFHPTVLAKKINGASLLVSEAVRGAGAFLTDKEGRRFMLEYDERGELAPRDIVSRSIEMAKKEHHWSHVYLDVRHFPSNQFKNSFPTIYNGCKKLGINPEIDLIPVQPAAHYFCGGIAVNLHAETSLDRLYAIGECSNTGLHGANRLASNSLLEALAFAHYAVQSSTERIKNDRLPLEFFKNVPKWKNPKNVSSKDFKRVRALKKEMQTVMSQKVGIFKTSQSLTEAENEFEGFYEQVKKIYDGTKLNPQILELRNLVNVGYLIIKQAQECKVNKGVFYNRDNE